MLVPVDRVRAVERKLADQVTTDQNLSWTVAKHEELVADESIADDDIGFDDVNDLKFMSGD